MPGWEDKVKTSFKVYIWELWKSEYKKEFLTKSDFYFNMARKLGYTLYFLVGPIAFPERYAKNFVEFLQAVNLEDSEEDVKRGMAMKVAEGKLDCLQALKNSYKENNPDWDMSDSNDIGYMQWKKDNILDVAECMETYEQAYDFISNMDAAQLMELSLNGDGGGSLLLNLMGGPSSGMTEEELMKKMLGSPEFKEEVIEKAKNQ